MPSAARTRGWDIFWISRCPNARDRRARARLHSPLLGVPGRFENCRLVGLACWIAAGGGRCRHQLFFARSSAPSNEFRAYNPNQITVRALLQLWMSGSQRIAARRPREAERAMSPVCTENLIRVADVMESPKLAE